MPTDRVHRHPQQAQLRAIPHHRPQPSASDAATRLQNARPAPNERSCTRYVAMHPNRRGVMPTDRVHRLPQQAQSRAIRPRRPQPSASDAASQPRNTHHGSEREPLHQLGSVTPPPSWCNTPLSGATLLSNKFRRGDTPQLPAKREATQFSGG